MHDRYKNKEYFVPSCPFYNNVNKIFQHRIYKL
jgi:hypothetical protein